MFEFGQKYLLVRSGGAKSNKNQRSQKIVAVFGGAGVLMMSGEELRFCNCAGCGELLMGDRYKDWYSALSYAQKKKWTQPVDCRIGGRPYCWDCANEVDESFEFVSGVFPKH